MPRKVTTKEQTSNIKFVLEIEKYPCLYNYTLEEYSSRDIVDAAWKKISDAFGETVNDCKVKWKNLRTVFVRNLRPRANRSSGRKAPYYLNQVLQFLVPYVKVQSSDEIPSYLAPPPEAEDEDHTREWNEENVDESGDEDEDENAEGGVSVYHTSQSANTKYNLSRYTQRLESVSSEKANTGEASTPKIKRKANPELNYFVEYSQEKKKKPSEPGSHRKSFLLSLLPEVESMSDTQFRLFRRNVVDAIDNILGQSYQDPRSQTPVSTSSASSFPCMQNYKQSSLNDQETSEAHRYSSIKYLDGVKTELEEPVPLMKD